MSTLGTKLIRGPQLLLSTAQRLVRQELTLRDLVGWLIWQAARRRIPRVELCSHDEADATELLDIAGRKFWWPSEFRLDDLGLVWAEVFLPFPPNGHAYEHEACRITPGTWVLDAGACEGFFVSYALARRARVLAVEPVSRLAYCLHKTFEREVKSGKAVIVNALLGTTNSDGFVKVAGSPIAAQRSHEGERVSGATIDGLLRGSLIPRVDFIKMDIEGAEVSALSAAQVTIRRYRPNLSLAVYHDVTDERRVRDIIRASAVRYDIRAKGVVRNRGKLVHQILHAWPTEDEPARQV
jgi:FkbM family methyltransferase